MRADEFLGIVQQNNDNNGVFRLGKIDPDYIGGNPRIIFDGENTVSQKRYEYLSSYVPKANDRVLLARVAGSYVIIGAIGNNPETPGLVVNGDFVHKGRRIGFFERPPVGIHQIYFATNNFDSVYSRVNRIITVLAAYGLAYTTEEPYPPAE